MGGVGVAGAYEATKRRNTDDFFPEITLKGEFLQKYRYQKNFLHTKYLYVSSGNQSY